MSTAPKPHPELLVYKEIGPGDMRKLLAESNDADTGGGARDLRLPWKTFRSVMHRIFTDEAVARGGKKIRTAQVTYKDANGKTSRTTLEYWPATTSRPAEDRVSKVHSNPALAGGRLPDQDKGRVFLLFIRWSNGEIRTYYAYEDELRTPGKWAAEVRSALLTCIADTDNRNSERAGSLLSVQGYYDFLDGTVHCHANG
ncbi:hypothetical protein [Nocardioides sp. GXZ039]|uniref:hypothetical protein n=1 Tax=Nocardioides sp. GXZ039 TaxID=3136018 RepID=UPI0030F3D96D